MSKLPVRELGQEPAGAQKRRTTSHDRSAEPEHRAIDQSSLLAQPTKRPLKELLAAMPCFNGDDELFDVR